MRATQTGQGPRGETASGRLGAGHGEGAGEAGSVREAESNTAARDRVIQTHSGTASGAVRGGPGSAPPASTRAGRSVGAQGCPRPRPTPRGSGRHDLTSRTPF